MLEDRFAQHDKVVVDKFVDPSADYEMSTYDYVVRPDTSSAAVTVTLPRVSEAKGRIYSIVARNGATNAVTVTHAGDSEGWSDITLNTDGAAALLYSDGMKWFNLV